jgi:hypothetical protein
MIQVNRQTKSSILGLIIVVVLAGWAAYAFSGGAGNPQVFLTVMAVVSILLLGGVAALLRTPKAG